MSYEIKLLINYSISITPSSLSQYLQFCF